MKKQPQTTNPDPNPNPTPAVEGEGSYTAARRFRKSSEAFVASGRVKQAAQDAAPNSPAEADQLKSAEEKGRSRARR